MISRLFPVVLILMAIGILVMYVHPVYTTTIDGLKTEIVGYKRALAAADEFKQKEAKLAADKAKLDPQKLTRLQAMLPDGVDNVQLILDLQGLAARSGLQLSNFDIKNEPTAPTVTATPTSIPATPIAATTAVGATSAVQVSGPTEALELSVKATGTYSAFRTFLDSVERSLRLLDVAAIDVAKGEGTGVYTYTVTFRLYWLR
ncbi:MAG: hypothetical protein JWN64_822 [Parcubacteria group bacterium]|nr:hypothetical protein [Parcubacteria group bacterium]